MSTLPAKPRYRVRAPSVRPMAAMAAEPVRRPPDPFDDSWWGVASSMTEAGVHVGPDTIWKLDVAQDALNALADPIGTLPIVFFKRRKDGTKQRIENHPVAVAIRSQSNADDTACELRSQLQLDLGWTRNGFARIWRGRGGQVAEIERLAWRYMTVRRVEGEIVYDYREPGRPRLTLMRGEVMHLRKTPIDDMNLCGRPVWETNAEVLGHLLAAKEHAQRFFRSGGVPPYALAHPAHFAAKADRDLYTRYARQAARSRDPLLLEYGIKPEAIPQQSMRDGQFDEQVKGLERRVAHIWRVPPHKVGDLERATFTNIEHQGLEFVTDALLPYAELWQQVIKRDLILEADVEAEFDFAGMLKGDIETRFKAYAAARQWGWLSINEIRVLENLNPIGPAGDRHLEPLNMSPAGTTPPRPGEGARSGFLMPSTFGKGGRRHAA